MTVLVCKVTDVSSRANRRVGQAVSTAIATAGATQAAVEEATGLTSPELDARLAGAAQFSVPQLVRAGGLLRVPTADLMGLA